METDTYRYNKIILSLLYVEQERINLSGKTWLLRNSTGAEIERYCILPLLVNIGTPEVGYT